MSDTSRKNNLKRVRGYLSKYRRYLYAGAVAIVLTSLFSLTVPWLIKDAIETLEAGTATRRTMLYYGLAVVVAALLGGFFMFFLRRTIIWASRMMAQLCASTASRSPAFGPPFRVLPKPGSMTLSK